MSEDLLYQLTSIPDGQTNEGRMQSLFASLIHRDVSWPTVLGFIFCLLGELIEHSIQKRKTGSSQRHPWEKSLKDVCKEQSQGLKKELIENKTVYEKIGTGIGLAFVLLEWSIAGLYAIYLYVWFMASFRAAEALSECIASPEKAQLLRSSCQERS